MTIGIYSLYWEKEDLVYVGLSQNIERRFEQHLNLCTKSTHTNASIQNAYDKYGKFSRCILEECKISELGAREKYWIKEFNSYAQGLNDTMGGYAFGNGVSSILTKYSKILILKVFSLLSKGYNPLSVSKRLSVNIRLPNSIREGSSHLWLQEDYPERYKLVNSSRNSSRSCTKDRLLTLESPEGVIFKNITNLSKFCRETKGLSHKVNSAVSGLSKLAKSTRASYEGWKVTIQ
jgi:group I intron endonuclease